MAVALNHYSMKFVTNKRTQRILIGTVFNQSIINDTDAPCLKFYIKWGHTDERRAAH